VAVRQEYIAANSAVAADAGSGVREQCRVDGLFGDHAARAKRRATANLQTVFALQAAGVRNDVGCVGFARITKNKNFSFHRLEPYRLLVLMSREMDCRTSSIIGLIEAGVEEKFLRFLPVGSAIFVQIRSREYPGSASRREARTTRS
jgi:hypothetical protein